MYIFEILLSIILWLIQLIVVLAVPIGIVVWTYKGNKSLIKKVFSIFVAVAILVCVIVYAYNPIVYCPSEYAVFLEPEVKKKIQQYNRGIYSFDIPVIPIFVFVEYIDGECIKTTTYYFLFGVTQMIIRPDGPYMTKGLFGW